VRYFLLAVLSAIAQAQSPLVKILSEELDRNFQILKQKGDPAPYFMGYSVVEQEADVISASAGALDGQNHFHQRALDVTIRTGSPQMDNYRRVNGDRPRFTTARAIALEDNPVAIRQILWLATDQVYRAASSRMIRLKADEKLRAQASDNSADFSTEEAGVFYSATPKYKFDANEWTNRLRKLSGEFTKYPGALNSSVSIEAQRVAKTLVTTEGTKLEHGRLFSRLFITARGKASDGMDLATLETFETADPSKLPKDAQILASVEKAGANLEKLLHAPLADPYVGPAILSGRAAGVFFHEIFGHRIEGHRQKDESEGQTFTKSVGAAGFSFDRVRPDQDGVRRHFPQRQLSVRRRGRESAAGHAGGQRHSENVFDVALADRWVPQLERTRTEGARARDRLAAVESVRGIVKAGFRCGPSQDADRRSEEAEQTVRAVLRSGEQRLYNNGAARFAGVYRDSAGGLSRVRGRASG
jgi:hypothetical protein